jgi:DNA polymerase/3'-5' exonuclease PolX
MENKDFAQLLSETADLMEIAGEDGFRIRSYRNAAAVILGHPERVQDILTNPERKVTEISGIGKGLAAVLTEIAQRGSFERRDEMLAKYPASALELLKIQGLGPKSIALLYQHHGVKTVDDLERICREQKLRELPRMGAKLEEKVLRSIESYRKSAGRFLMSFGRRIADELIAEFSALPGVERVKRSAISIYSLPDQTPWLHSITLFATRNRRKCWAKAVIRRASLLAWNVCKWMCAHCRKRASARRCNISPAAKSTTWRCARKPSSKG